jgi:hypothetical protein
LLEKTGGVQTQFWGEIWGQKIGHPNLLEKTGGVQTQFWGQISGQKELGTLTSKIEGTLTF